MDENIKREWEDKIRASYAGSDQLLKFMTETMENFAYRYISTSKSASPKVVATSETTLSVTTLEDSMVNALKTANPAAKVGITELARRVPKAQAPSVQYRLSCQIHTLKPDQGKLILSAQINWNFPTHEAASEQQVTAYKTFTWDDLQVFRKGFPLAVQEVADLFL